MLCDDAVDECLYNMFRIQENTTEVDHNQPARNLQTYG